jgi:hypothetical protein
MKPHLIVFAATFLGALTVGPPPAAAQASSPAHTTTAGSSKNWTVPRTAWGDPDLQGLWPANDMQGTPYERPPQFGERATLTPQELAERQAQTVRQEEVDSKPSSTRSARPGAPEPARRRTGASAASRPCRLLSSSIRPTGGFRR